MADQPTALTSILFTADVAPRVRLESTAPDTFVDLNLDQLVDAVVAGRDEYELRPYFFTPLTRTEEVEFRHAIIRDLRSGNVADVVRAFAQAMKSMREQLALANRLRYRFQRERVFLDAVSGYIAGVGALASGLMPAELASDGMLAFRDHLDRYVGSAPFSALAEDADRVSDGLATVDYEYLIDGNRISVFPHTEEADYSAGVTATFAKFKQGTVKSRLETYADTLDMNHVEAGILNLVAEIFPGQFTALDEFFHIHEMFESATLARFDREVQFYLAYEEFLDRATGGGLASCLPTVTTDRTSVAVSAYDLALAHRFAGGTHTLVTNGFSLTGDERVLVVTGANQGGKTTFARTFGQVHYLASLGLPVAAESATVHLPDRLFAHFERQEDLQNLSGKLEDDLIRMHAILEAATGDSIVIMNEIFTSTTLHDALFLGAEILGRLIDLDAIGVCVTFVDELSTLSATTVSMVAEVDPDDVVSRTFHIERRPADGLAYATAIADRYGLSSGRLRERIAS